MLIFLCLYSQIYARMQKMNGLLLVIVLFTKNEHNNKHINDIIYVDDDKYNTRVQGFF